MSQNQLPLDDSKVLTSEEEAELQAIDEMLKEQNPDFENDLADLKNEKIEGVVLDFETEDRKQKIKEKLKIWYFKTVAILKIWLINAYYFTKKSTLTRSKQLVAWSVKKTKAGISIFRILSLKQKLQLSLILVLISFFPVGVHFLIKYIQQVSNRGVITDLTSIADQVYPFDAKSSFEPFYNSTRTPPNIFLIKRFVANLTPTQGPNHLPMMAAELLIESLNPQPLAEIKSRESFFRDQIRAFTEKWTFEELSSKNGKDQYLYKLKEDIQKHIRQGQLSKIYFKAIVVKP